MSGSFEQLDVPPTLVSFATAMRQGRPRGLHRVQEAGEQPSCSFAAILDHGDGLPQLLCSLKANCKTGRAD